MEAMLTFILGTILFFYLAGIVGRWALARWVQKKQREFEQQGGNGPYSRVYTWGSRGQGNRARKPEGEVSIQRTQAAEKRVSKNIGDYVEYEEVEVEATETTEIFEQGREPRAN